MSRGRDQPGKSRRKTGFLKPPRSRSAQGLVRRVGFELEFAGIGLGVAADLVAQVFGGTRNQKSPFQYSVDGASYGGFGIEIDARILKDRSYREAIERLGISVDNGGVSDGDRALVSRRLGSSMASRIPAAP